METTDHTDDAHTGEASGGHSDSQQAHHHNDRAPEPPESSAESSAGSSSSRAAEAGGEAGGRRSRSNSAKSSKAWKVKGMESPVPSSPSMSSSSSPSSSELCSSLSAVAAAAAAAAPLAEESGQRQQLPNQHHPHHPPSGSPSSSPSSVPAPSSKPRSRRNTKETEEGAAVVGHRLQTPWTFWFSRKDKRRSNSMTAGSSGSNATMKEQGKTEHSQNLVKIGTCRTVEEFWHNYVYTQRPSNLPKESNLYFFRNQLEPMWETFPKGGCFIIKIDKRAGALDKMWEELLFAAIGELFEEPQVVGVEVSIRSKEDGLAVWTKTNQKRLRFSTLEKLKLMLNLVDVMYKSNATSIKDRSTYKNAQRL